MLNESEGPATDPDPPDVTAQNGGPGLPAPPVDPPHQPGPAAAAPDLAAGPSAAGQDGPGGRDAGIALAALSAAVGELAGAAERYHDRAAQREGVIDYLRTELDTLRRGERRGMLRPLLTEMCRLPQRLAAAGRHLAAGL